MGTLLEPKYLSEYIEGWRRKIWNHSFGLALKGANAFKKLDLFLSYDGLGQTIQRVNF